MGTDLNGEDQYERRLAELQDRYETFARRVYRVLAVIVVGLLLVAGAAAYLYDENKERSGEIASSLVQGCKENGNPLRTAVRKFGNTLIDQTQRQIEQSKAFETSGTYAEIFPDFSPDKLHALLAEGREEDRRTKGELEEANDGVEHVDCEARYP